MLRRCAISASMSSRRSGVRGTGHWRKRLGGGPVNSMDRLWETVRRTHLSAVEASHWWRKKRSRPPMGVDVRESFPPLEGLGARSSEGSPVRLLGSAPVTEVLPVGKPVGSLSRGPVGRGPGRSPKGLPLRVRCKTPVVSAESRWQHLPLILVLHKDWLQCGPKQIGGLIRGSRELPFGFNIGLPLTEPREPPRGHCGSEGPRGKFHRIQ